MTDKGFGSKYQKVIDSKEDDKYNPNCVNNVNNNSSTQKLSELLIKAGEYSGQNVVSTTTNMKTMS